MNTDIDTSELTLSVSKATLDYLLEEVDFARRYQDRDAFETSKAIRNALSTLADILGVSLSELEEHDEDDELDELDEDN